MAVHSRARCDTVPSPNSTVPYAVGTGTLSTFTLAGGPQQLNAWAITVTMEEGGTYAFGTYAQTTTEITFTATPSSFGSGSTTASYKKRFGKLDVTPSKNSKGARVVITNDTRTNAANNFQGKPLTFWAETMSSDGSAAAINYKCDDYGSRSHPGQSGQLTDPWVEDDEITIEFFNEPVGLGIVKDLV